MSIRTPLARALNRGSAKDGLHHWWMQRLTALALVPLVIWLVISVISLIGAPYGEFVAWVSNPISAVLLSGLIIATFYHAALGMQVIYEDYIHTYLVRLAIDLVTKGILTILALLALYSVLSLALA
jgi:succinate dehydrogenase / fumarate reductase membrane anchor subunit